MNANVAVLESLPHADLALKNNVKLQKNARIISISFLMTGLFAAFGALYRWGDGPLFPLSHDVDLQLYLAELVIAAPSSILTAVGISKLRRWGMLTALFSTGVYIYGSALVYASLILGGFPIQLKLFLPPIFGIGLSVATIKWIWANFDLFQ